MYINHNFKIFSFFIANFKFLWKNNQVQEKRRTNSFERSYAVIITIVVQFDDEACVRSNRTICFITETCTESVLLINSGKEVIIDT